jgi:DNA invertase Pin-like site-specific DNA recombinase
MTDKKLRAVFYARVSTEEEMQINALGKQIQENKDVIKDKGWILVDSYIDEGKSGTKTKGRKEYNRLFEDMSKDKFDVIVIKSQDRLMRNTLDWYLFLDRLINNDLQLYMYLDNSFYTPEDRFITGIKAQMAEEYSRDLSKKLNNANRRRVEKALQGEPLSAMGNGRSLGYAIQDGKWVQVPEQIEVCKLIWDLYEKYDSLRKVRDEINNRGYTNTVGKPFTTESIGRILKNEKAKGVILTGVYHHDFDKKKIVRKHDDEKVHRFPAPELAYVTEERFERVQQRLKEKTVNGRGKKVGRDALSGKIFCSICGGGLWRRESSRIDKDGEKKKYYHWDCSNRYSRGVCTGVHTTTLAIRKVYHELTKDIVINRQAVKKDIVSWLEKLKKELLANRDTESMQKEIERLERRKNKLTEAYLDEILPKDEYKLKYNEIDSQINTLKASLAPVEEDEEIKEIEYTLSHIDSEIDEYLGTVDIAESKIDWLIDHTKKITVLENTDLVIELDMITGAIIAGKDFFLFVHSSMPYCVQMTNGTKVFLKVA